jgi:phospholipase C
MMDRTRVVREIEAAAARLRARRHQQPANGAPDPDRPIGTDAVPQVRHIVILMMENHSYDNYLGTLERGEGLSAAPPAANRASDGRVVEPHRLPTTQQYPNVPTQSWDESHQQWAGGSNDGFVASAERQRQPVDPGIAMGYWTEDDLPYYHALARTFPLSDRWFSSCLGPTFPNRRFLIAGTAHGLSSDSLTHTLDRPTNGTIFDQLNRYGISWANYHPVSHIRPVGTRLMTVHGLRAGRHIGGYVKAWLARLGTAAANAKSRLQFTADAYPLGLFGYLNHVRSIDRFLRDAAAGALPAVSLVDPDFRQNSEENPQDIREGEAFAAKIINAAMHGKGWANTVLIWVYDEHGGYYDHVPPPEAPEPDDRRPEGEGPWGFDRYGFRVPAVIVSPFARPDYVSHVVHDHTSILKLIETKWNLPPLTRRDAHADNLLDSIDLSRPPAFAEPPSLPRPARGNGSPARSSRRSWRSAGSRGSPNGRPTTSRPTRTR